MWRLPARHGGEQVRLVDGYGLQHLGREPAVLGDTPADFGDEHLVALPADEPRGLLVVLRDGRRCGEEVAYEQRQRLGGDRLIARQRGKRLADLVEAARQDDTFDAQERAGIQNLLTRKFDLKPEECRVLLAAAETRASEMVQMHSHTSAVFEQMAYEDRVQLVEMLWEVAYADGVLDPEEDLLIRRISGLMYVEDRERVLARQRVVARLGLKPA